MSREEVPELIRLLELLNLQHRELEAEALEIQAEQQQVQAKREAATERLRLARAREEGDAWANRSPRAQARHTRPPTRLMRIGNRVVITNKVNLPRDIAGTRPVNETDRRGVITLVKSGKVYLVTDSGNNTWWLRKNIIHEQ